MKAMQTEVNSLIENETWELVVGNRGVGNLRLIGLVGLGPFHLLGSLLTTTNISICPHMTSYSNTGSFTK